MKTLRGLVMIAAFIGGTASMPSASAGEPRNARVDGVLATTDGVSGYVLKEVGGSVRASRNASTVFEPASAVKVLYLLTALRAVEAGKASLTEPIRVGFLVSPLSCPMDPFDPSDVPGGSALPPEATAPLRAQTTTVETLEVALGKMMKNSDNARTYAVRKRFGRDAIIATGRAIGMTSTDLRHEIGCAFFPIPDTVPALKNVPLPVAVDEAAIEKNAVVVHRPNRTTLADLTLLYEKGLKGSLLSPALQQVMWRGMLSSEAGHEPGKSGSTEIDDLVAQEAAETFDSAVPKHYLEHVRWASKGGSYSGTFLVQAHCGPPLPNPCTAVPYVTWGAFTRTGAGWLELPYLNRRTGKIETKQFVWGYFIDQATDERSADQASKLVFGELVRAQVRTSLGTFTRS